MKAISTLSTPAPRREASSRSDSMSRRSISSTTPTSPSVGHFSAEHFDPPNWKPRVPNPAFRRARPDDTFWGARRVMAFTDEMIRAAVRTGQYSDPAAEKHIADTLIARRDAIGRAWLTNVNPVVDPVLDASGTLSFRNAAVVAGVSKAPASYEVAWFAFRQRDRYGDGYWSGSGGKGRAGERPAGCADRRRLIRARGYQGRQSTASVVGESRARLLPAGCRGLEAGRVRAAPGRSPPLSRKGVRPVKRQLERVSLFFCGCCSIRWPFTPPDPFRPASPVLPEVSSSSSPRSRARSTCPECKWSCGQQTRTW